jgi:hypothetical protein
LYGTRHQVLQVCLNCIDYMIRNVRFDIVCDKKMEKGIRIVTS